MVTTVNHYSSSNVSPDDGLGGVVRVTADGYYGTGTLLYDGRAILTAAHVVEGVDAAQLAVYFDDETRHQLAYSVADSVIYSGYDAQNSNGDLAILWLEESAPSDVFRFNLYHDEIVDGDAFLLAGYGLNGTGATGVVNDGNLPDKMKAYNTFDLNSDDFSWSFENTMAWNPLDGAIWAADFDSGWVAQDNLGYWSGETHLGQGAYEGMIAPGDSGGPAIIDGQVAGVASYTASLPAGNNETDVDTTINSSFGEVGFWQNVNYYEQWIDQSVRDALPNVPTSPSEVKGVVTEGDQNTPYAYFMVNFHGDRAEVEGALQLDYRTLDGTAVAGEDFVTTSGTLVFYPGENQLVVAVEILDDRRAEGEESFYLEVYNPVGASFVNGAASLIGEKRIVDDDYV